MMSARKLFTFCLLFQSAHVLGSAQWGSNHRSQVNPAARAAHGGNENHAEDVAYDTTVTTEMNYYMSEDSKSEKKRSYHAEYEYIAAGDHHTGAPKHAKSGKKGGYHTHAPTHVGDYPHGKGSKNGGYPIRTHAPTHTGPASGKGKGKGGTHAPTHMGPTEGKGKGKGKGKGGPHSKSSKSSKSGKGKGGKGSKKGGEYYPTISPHPTPAHAPSADYPSSRPPSPVGQPTRPSLSPAYSPSITASPTDEGSVAVDLQPFALLYETEMQRQASRAELAEVTDVTRLYLEEFMFAEFEGTTLTYLDDFVTRMITSTFLTGDVPYVIDYSSTARFSPFSPFFPSTEQLDEALVIAFSGANMAVYESRLAGLPENNVFHGASCFFGDDSIARVSQQQSGNNAASIAAAAVAATLIAAGAVLYKRRMQGETFEKDLDKGKGDSTVAGDTFAGETYDGTASVSAASLDHLSRYRDDGDDEGTKGQSLLGTIDEDEDSDSVRPTWGDNPSYDEGEDGHALNMSLDGRSVASGGAEHRVLRRAATEGSSVAASTSASDIPATQSFDEMALQGLAHTVTRGNTNDDDDNDNDELVRDSKPEIASLLSHDSMDDHSIARAVSSSSSSKNSRRPKTVEEIEAMLSADHDDNDEESQAYSSRSRSFGNDNSTTATPQRPRTVEEIESLLSAGLEDDLSEGTELD